MSTWYTEIVESRSRKKKVDLWINSIDIFNRAYIFYLKFLVLYVVSLNDYVKSPFKS